MRAKEESGLRTNPTQIKLPYIKMDFNFFENSNGRET